MDCVRWSHTFARHTANDFYVYANKHSGFKTLLMDEWIEVSNVTRGCNSESE